MSTKIAMHRLLFLILTLPCRTQYDDTTRIDPVCDATRQMFHDTGCCGDTDDTVSVCVSPSLDLDRLTSFEQTIRQMLPKTTLDAIDLRGETLTATHGNYRYHRMRTRHLQDVGFIPEVLYFLHILTGARVRLEFGFESPEYDLEHDVHLGRKDVIPLRLDAEHLFNIQGAAPSCGALHHLIVRKSEVAEFEALLRDLDDPVERVRTLLNAGKHVSTCNCEQYMYWIDPNYGNMTLNNDNSYIFGDLGNTPIYNYDKQWWNKVSSGDADWTFTDDHMNPNLVDLPSNLQVVEIEMAVRSEQVLFGNSQKPYASKLRRALGELARLGLYDYSYCRWSNLYDHDKSNAYAATGRDALDASPVDINATTFAFGDYLIQFSGVSTSEYTTSSGTRLGGFVAHTLYTTTVGVGATAPSPPVTVAPPSPPSPPTPPAPPPLPPLAPPPPFTRPATSPPPEFCEECEFGGFDSR